ncbi:SLAP domain-containing protein [Companilactobacillus kimchiensis]|uniref:Cell surface protein n=1 Tax=Companilactobacillus kimchiensis TaxID=993692 RepID=A0A0R2LP58_9LACO|nr:SLAP domain-containing protein [Companilactobacillus kimchiensis]KRO00122.1 cell surface protein [Companilactobacillus kimchiensis]
MNLSKSASIIAALAMATTGALLVSQKQDDASTIATVTTDGPARLYDVNGNMITDRALAPNSQWLVGKVYRTNDKAIYQVSNNEYLRSEDSYLTGDLAFTQPSREVSTKLIGTINRGNATLYRDDTNKLSAERELSDGSVWAIGKHYVNKNGEDFFQVSTHEYVNGSHLSLNRYPDDGTYSANFGISGADQSNNNSSVDTNTDNSNTNTNDNSNNTNTSVDTNTDTSNNNNTSSNTTDTNTDNSGSTSTDTDNGSYQPNLANINKYFVAYLNALHKANGTEPVQLSDDMMNYATQRAGQQDGNNLDHSTASRDTSENLSGAGFNYMGYQGIKSDKDAAYFLLKEWYDEGNNMDGVGQPGHFGHRAALIYSGPNVGLGITDTDASFDADWNESELDAQNKMFYATSEPNTQFISKDAI